MKKYLLGLLLASFNAFAGMSVDIYLRDKNTDGVGWYLAGLGNGFAFSNIKLESLGEKRLFCPPKDHLINIAELKTLLNAKIGDYDSRAGQDLWIEPLLLNELRARYACN